MIPMDTCMFVHIVACNTGFRRLTVDVRARTKMRVTFLLVPCSNHPAGHCLSQLGCCATALLAYLDRCAGLLLSDPPPPDMQV